MAKRKRKQQSESEEKRKSARRSNNEQSTSSNILQNICIFCQKTKYKTGTNTREPLRCCHEMRLNARIRELATERHDSRILAIASDELVAKEAKYHHFCYKNFTRTEMVVGEQDTLTIDILKETVKKCLNNAEGNIA